MSQEKQKTNDHLQRKSVLVASADNMSARYSSQNQAGKRKRIRVSTTSGGLAPKREPITSDNHKEYHREREIPQHLGQRVETASDHYQKRYQEERKRGNLGYDYKNITTSGQDAQPKPKKKRKKPIQPVGEPVRYAENLAPDTELRLNKYLAKAGICSRREADILITQGEVSVNGVVVTELGCRVKVKDLVEYKGKRVEGQSKVYVLLNKPKNCVTTSDDPECRFTVMDLVRNACPERIYPVGRLDRQTTGVLLITNDGDLAAKLTHPSFLKKKIYHVWLDRPVTMEHMQAIADGIMLEDGEIHADALSYVTEEDLSQVGIEIHSGRNRIVRRIFEHFGYRVLKLDRVYFAGLTKKNLRRGQWRYLNEQEVNNLRMGAFE